MVSVFAEGFVLGVRERHKRCVRCATVSGACGCVTVASHSVWICRRRSVTVGVRPSFGWSTPGVFRAHLKQIRDRHQVAARQNM